MKTLTEQFNELESLMEGSLNPNDTKDMMKSLSSLVKYNQGKFKSARQAKYLYKTLIQARTAFSERWGQRWTKGKKNAFAAELVSRLSQFGSKTKSKIRYYGFLYVIDGGGVVRAARAQIDHKGHFNVVGEKELVFQRKGPAPELYDHAGEIEAQKKKATANQPLIDKIEAVPGYERNDFLQDMVWNLELGRTLSPAQMKVVNKFVPVEIGDYQEWVTAWKEGKVLIASKFLDPAIRAMRVVASEITANPDWDDRAAKNATRTADEYEAFKKSWLKKPAKHAEFDARYSDIANKATEMGFRGNAPLTGLWALSVASRRKGKTGKATLKFVRDGISFVDWLRRLSPSRSAQHEREMWLEVAGAPPPSGPGWDWEASGREGDDAHVPRHMQDQ